jgi:hypothetical protein
VRLLYERFVMWSSRYKLCSSSRPWTLPYNRQLLGPLGHILNGGEWGHVEAMWRYERREISAGLRGDRRPD